MDDLFLERRTRSKGRAIITASRPAEVSIELPELGHGLFTYYLLQGLRGAADLNRDGIVSLQELYEYVEQQVSQKSRAVGGNPHPVRKGEREGPLPLVQVGGRGGGKGGGVDPVVSLRARDGNTWLVITGRASRNITDGFGFVFDDPYGELRVSSARTFGLWYSPSELTTLAIGVQDRKSTRLNSSH